jgi:hypothetical protein
MKIFFGLELDDLVIPQPQNVEGGVHYFGPKSLLFMLESHLGLIGHPTNNEYLRIEQYRQAILRYLDKNDTPFYTASFNADQFATATELLSRRDELLLAGWNFEIKDDTPYRLKTIAELEQVFKTPNEDGEFLSLSPGYADRFMEVLEKVEKRKQPIIEIVLNEPIEILPFHFQKLFNKLQLNPRSIKTPHENDPVLSDLSKFKNRLLASSGKKEKIQLQNDGSLLLLKSKRASDAAGFVAKTLKLNTDLRPNCLIPEKNRALDIALIQEGLPSLGIQSASLARPTLQILKLITVFLWNPIDPFKILEFVSLSVKPLADDLATQIASQMARTPGLNGEGWYITIKRYFDTLAEKAKTDSSIKMSEIRNQYEFWFERRRYDMSQTVPKRDVIDIFDYLQTWAFKKFDDSNGKNNSLLVLSEQAKRVKELLEALPEVELSYLELERIVRTIYEPSPIVFQDCEVGHLPYVMHASAIIDEIPDLLWWNFSQNEPVHFFSRWYQKERNFLSKKDIELETPERENTLLIWQRRRPVLNTQNRLILVMPENVDGSAVHPHPLFGDLEAAFKNLGDISLDIDSGIGKANFEKHFKLPSKVEIEHRLLGHPKPFLQISNLDKISQREYETLTSLETLFYYPYQWIFKYKIRLHKSSILSVTKDNTLMGNLAHRMFEKLFNEDITTWNKSQVEKWIDGEAGNLLAREGAVLLMYGREPEKIGFINQLKYSAWSLVSQIQQNGWKVKKTEMDLVGNFQTKPVKGIADLVLEKENELTVIDLKWRGASRRERIIKNEEDLQLVLYSRLLTEDDSWAHTAYFIMENGKILARNNLAFNNITSIAPDTDHTDINNRILGRMESTYEWRMNQIEKGQIEIRTKHTCLDLEDIYNDNEQPEIMMDILEMKDGDAPFCDYKTLINLVD